MKNRPKVEKVSYQMREWSTLLGQELLAWRGVSFRRMFGMTVFYRDGVVFAALPRTLAFDPPSSIGFKICKQSPGIARLLRSDPRIVNHNQEKGWITFQINGSQDLAGALQWFTRAYKSCIQAPSRTK